MVAKEAAWVLFMMTEDALLPEQVAGNYCGSDMRGASLMAHNPASG